MLEAEDYPQQDPIQLTEVEDFELIGGTRVEIKVYGKTHLYIFKDENGDELFQRKGDIPARVTEQSDVGKEIKRLLDPTGRLIPKALKEDFLIAMQAMQEYWKAKELYDSQEDNSDDKEHELLVKQAIDTGFEQLKQIDQSFLYVASLTDWYAAGERMNILYAWIAYCSQVILREPISVVIEGEAGKGKTKIQESALAMIPSEFVETVKSTTDAALFGYCDDDAYFFDGLIVNIGDMGGKRDHEEAENFKNAIKELQTDGYMSRTKQVPDVVNGGYINQKYELFGKPCLTYTNVPNYNQDEQEQSRGVFLRPRNDHKKAFMIFKRLDKQKGTDSAILIEEHVNKQEIIRNMVYALRKRHETVTIYNPYWSFMEGYLDKSKYLFRDTDKYDGILRVITAINGYNRRIYKINDQETLFTTREDISFFLELLEQYHRSIVSNLSPGAMEVLSELEDHKNDWFDEEERTLTPGITINTYCELSGTNLVRNTIQKYFKELEDAGYLMDTTPDKREKHFNFGRIANVLDSTQEVRLTKLDRKVMEFNYGAEATNTFEDEEGYGVSLKDMHPDVIEPLWNKYLPKEKKYG